MMDRIGHNGGPTMEPGAAWRRHCWQAARAALVPTLPLEVLRTRVRRAKDLGLDYKTYASVRAATGHDVVACLFSSNALRLRPHQVELPPDRAERLFGVVACDRVALVQGRIDGGAVLAANPGLLDRVGRAPLALAGFREAGGALRLILGKVPGDRVVLIGDMTLEQAWCAAGRLGYYLPAERYFAAVS